MRCHFEMRHSMFVVDSNSLGRMIKKAGSSVIGAERHHTALRWCLQMEAVIENHYTRRGF